MRSLMLCAALSVLLPTSAIAKVPAESEAAANPAVDKLVGDFFEAIKAGKSQGAVHQALANSPLMAGRDADLQNLTAQVDNAIRIYGPILSVEKVSDAPLGTGYDKRYYLVRQEKMVTRWEFEFGRLKDGWAIVYFGFDDQVRNWG